MKNNKTELKTCKNWSKNKVMQIVSLGSKLSKTVDLLAVRLDLAEIQLKNRKKKVVFFY